MGEPALDLRQRLRRDARLLGDGILFETKLSPHGGDLPAKRDEVGVFTGHRGGAAHTPTTPTLEPLKC